MLEPVSAVLAKVDATLAEMAGRLEKLEAGPVLPLWMQAPEPQRVVADPVQDALHVLALLKDAR
jgi:hypothetical protein